MRKTLSKLSNEGLIKKIDFKKRNRIDTRKEENELILRAFEEMANDESFDSIMDQLLKYKNAFEEYIRVGGDMTPIAKITRAITYVQTLTEQIRKNYSGNICDKTCDALSHLDMAVGLMVKMTEDAFDIEHVSCNNVTYPVLRSSEEIHDINKTLNHYLDNVIRYSGMIEKSLSSRDLDTLILSKGTLTLMSLDVMHIKIYIHRSLSNQ